MKKDTLRLILFLKCNLACSYCCNEIESVNLQFVKKKFTEIDFSGYANVCVTGGEPFLEKVLLYKTLDAIPLETKKNSSRLKFLKHRRKKEKCISSTVLQAKKFLLKQL